MSLIFIRFFHLLTENPWPFVGSVGALLITFGAVNIFFSKSYTMFVLGLTLLSVVLYVWFGDMMKEKFYGGHNSQMSKMFQFGMIMFILSEMFFFFGFFWAFFYNSVNPLVWESNFKWPPFHSLDAWSVPFLKTLLLVSSGVTLTWAHHLLLELNHKVNFILIKMGFLLTMGLGVSFEYLQVEEYINKFFGLNSTIYGSTFYMLTGFHGFHVLMGLLMLMVSWMRFNLLHFTPNGHTHLLLGSWYWHFVDVVWLFLFCFIYLGYQSLPN